MLGSIWEVFINNSNGERITVLVTKPNDVYEAEKEAIDFIYTECLAKTEIKLSSLRARYVQNTWLTDKATRLYQATMPQSF